MKDDAAFSSGLPFADFTTVIVILQVGGGGVYLRPRRLRLLPRQQDRHGKQEKQQPEKRKRQWRHKLRSCFNCKHLMALLKGLALD